MLQPARERVERHRLSSVGPLVAVYAALVLPIFLLRAPVHTPTAGRMVPNRVLRTPAAVITDHRQHPRVWSVEVLQAYGWPDLTEAHRALTERERRYAGGVLGEVAAIAIGPDSAVYVLDSGFQKVAVFNRDGTLRRLIFGGYGRGPGEFVFPRGLSVFSKGTVAVLDMTLDRITIFDTSGSYRNSFQLPVSYPLGLFPAGSDELYVLQGFNARGPDNHILLVFSKDGVQLRSELTADKREELFAEHGYLGAIGTLLNGRAIFAFASPGLWTLLDEGSAGPVAGRELFPKVQGTVVRNARGDPIRRIQVGTVAVGSFDRDRVGIAYHRKRDPSSAGSSPQPPDLILVSLDSLGVVRDSVNLTASLGGGFLKYPTPHVAWAQEFYVQQDEPYPRVLRCRLKLMAGR